MVEVRERLYVTAEDFFEQIAESVAYDITESTGKKVQPQQIIAGYTYHKKMKNKMGRQGGVKVTVTNFDFPLAYRAEFQSIHGVNQMSYSIEKLDDNCIQVIYHEDFSGNSKALDLNSRIMGILYRRSAKKRAARMLKSMESYILKNK